MPVIIRAPISYSILYSFTCSYHLAFDSLSFDPCELRRSEMITLILQLKIQKLCEIENFIQYLYLIHHRDGASCFTFHAVHKMIRVHQAFCSMVTMSVCFIFQKINLIFLQIRWISFPFPNTMASKLMLRVYTFVTLFIKKEMLLFPVKSKSCGKQ